ncbi:TatD family deoxyribonuclease [Patescibacteria group bacterium]|nr:MAG: TatD family deoxyribonuclease [Patescibacteria group bacterium]
MIPKYFDVHSHVTFKDYESDIDAVLMRMYENGVLTATVGVNLATSKEAVRFGEGKDNFYSIVGLHPTDAPKEQFVESEYRELLVNPKVIGIGECGYDYYRLVGDLDTEKKRQQAEFEKQMECAITYNKPLMIHCRPTKGTVDAYEDILNVLEARVREVGEKLRGNVHFFVGNVEVARRFYEIGFTTSFTGVLTFTHDYDDVVRFAPLSMLLTETDAPFATPVPFRGSRNEPHYVKYVVEAIAGIKGVDVEETREKVLQNALRVFTPSNV